MRDERREVRYARCLRHLIRRLICFASWMDGDTQARTHNPGTLLVHPSVGEVPPARVGRLSVRRPTTPHHPKAPARARSHSRVLHARTHAIARVRHVQGALGQPRAVWWWYWGPRAASEAGCLERLGLDRGIRRRRTRVFMSRCGGCGPRILPARTARARQQRRV